MPSVSGTTRGPIVETVAPAGTGAAANAASILADWRQATFDAAITGLAEAQLKPQYEAALSRYAQRAGRDLQDEEVMAVVEMVNERSLEPARQRILAGKPDRKKLVDQALADARRELPKMKDPFTPVARGDVKARAKERVLYENQSLVVLVDRFAQTPHILVVPKQRASLPTEIKPAVLDQMGKVAEAVSEAFTALTRSAPSQAWVNPPQRLTISQVHMHVEPGLPPLPKAIEQRFWAAFEKELQQRLP